jgi:Mrp family chromosome partitioning ATPase
MERTMKSVQLAAHDRAPGTEVVGFEDGERARAPADVGEVHYTQTRVLEVAPAALERNRVLTGRGQDPASRAYKVLRTHVLQRLAAEDWQTIAVVSPAAGEGKTLTAINLAISLASAQNHTALLVDLDWRQPSVHDYFDFVPEHDVCDYLRGDRPLSSVLVNPKLPRFCFLPCARPVQDSSEQLLGLAAFARELKGRYRNRIVLFDLPPLLATDDALGFLPYVDCALLVVEEGKTKRDDIARSLAMIGPDRLVGTVMNKSRRQLPGY